MAKIDVFAGAAVVAGGDVVAGRAIVWALNRLVGPCDYMVQTEQSAYGSSSDEIRPG